MVKTGFTHPELFDYSGNMKKEWYVGFRHTCIDCGIRKPYQFRFGINFFTTTKERTADGKSICKILHQALDTGWNPHHEKIEEFLSRTEEPESELQRMPLNEAISFALEKKRSTMAPKSYSCINSTVRFIQKSAKAISIDRMPVYEVKRRHIKMLLEQSGKHRQESYDKEGKGRKWTGNAYNKYKGYLQLLFSELLEYDAVEYNPCLGISNKPKIITNIHRHATLREEQRIKEFLSIEHRAIYRYLAFEELLGIRPVEILGLKVSDYDNFNQCFDLDPKSEVVKNRTARKVPVPNTLLKFIEEMQLENYSPNDYIFSTYFLPGNKKKKRDYATKTWNELIKDRLGMNVSLYSFKGLGGEKKRQAGIGLNVVSKQSFGHASVNMSKIYLHGEGERERQIIIEQTPEF